MCDDQKRNDADFRPEVNIDNQGSEFRGYTVGVEDVKAPRSHYDANAWTFARFVRKSYGEMVDIRVCMYDVSGIKKNKLQMVR